MIFFSVGLPSKLAQTCDSLLHRLAEAALGSVECGAFNSLDELAAAAIRSSASHLAVSSRQPVLRLQSEIVQSGRPFLVALDDLHLALHDLLRRPGYDTAMAVRELASSSAAMLTLAAAPGALVLSRADREDRLALAESITRHFGFRLGARDLRRVIASAAPAENNEASGALDLDADQQATVDGALAPYAGYFGNGELAPLLWQAGLFFSSDSRADQPPRPVTGAVDITGRGRIVIFGPYINLPPGPWSASVVIAFSAETAGIGFVIEVYAGTQLAAARVQPAGEQVLDTNLEFTIGNSLDQPIEIRVITERAAFDGRIALGYVSLVPRSGLRGETEQQLIRTLHR
jgi:hypothetical protein